MYYINNWLGTKSNENIASIESILFFIGLISIVLTAFFIIKLFSRNSLENENSKGGFSWEIAGIIISVITAIGVFIIMLRISQIQTEIEFDRVDVKSEELMVYIIDKEFSSIEKNDIEFVKKYHDLNGDNELVDVYEYKVLYDDILYDVEIIDDSYFDEYPYQVEQISGRVIGE